MPSISEIINRKQRNYTPENYQYGSPLLNKAGTPQNWWTGHKFNIPGWVLPEDPFTRASEEAALGAPSAPSPTSQDMATGHQEDWDPADGMGDPNLGAGKTTPGAAWDGVTGFAKEYGPEIGKAALSMAISGGPMGYALGAMGRAALGMTEDPFGRNILDRNNPFNDSFLGWDHGGVAAPDGWSGPQTDAEWAEEENTGGIGETSEGLEGYGGFTDEGFDSVSGTDEGESSGSSSESEESDEEEEDGETMYRGGLVTKKNMRGPDPAGPDDGYVGLDVGEFVLTKDATGYYGSKLLSALNQKRIPKKAISLLLK